MIRIVIAVLILSGLVALLMIDKQDEMPAVNVASTSQPTSPPLDPAHTTGPNVTMPTTTTTVVVKLLPKARTAPIDDVWHAIAMCETGGTMDRYIQSDTDPVYYSYFQWSLSTWRQAGGVGHPFDSDYETQKRLAVAWQKKAGWSQWPTCAARLGLIA